MFGPFLLVLIALFAIAIWMYLRLPSNQGATVKYSFFWEQVTRHNNVKEVTLHGDVLTGTWRTPPDDPKAEKPKDDEEAKKLPEKFNTRLPKSVVDSGQLTSELLAVDKDGKRKYDIAIDSEDSGGGMGTQLLLWLIVPVLLIGFFLFIMRRNSDPMGSGMMGNFIRSQAKRFHASEQRTTFDDVAGMDQAKADLMEIVEFLKSPEKFQKLGAQIPKGVLLMGPPGTGKTLLARATAGEAGVPFYSINGSEFIQMFVGVGASRVRDLFRTAKENSPCIMFIDEIDAVGRVRGAGVGGGHDEREQTLNQILGEMDGFLPTESVIVLAATNRPDVLDPALLRPGRFDRHVAIDRPSKKGRVGILKVHTRKVPLGDDVDLEAIAAGAIGFSGADLKNLVNEAALNATREDKKRVEMEDFEKAQDKVLMGATREELVNEHEKEMTAYHEAGHALLAWLFAEVDQVHKVSIIPRGRALGVTQLLPDEERFNIGEKRLHSQLAFIMGGRAAEKMIFDEYSAGAEDDLKRATELARKMVAHWGMSEVIGPVAFRQAEEHPFLGKEMHEQRQFSEETARIIDQEVQNILTKAGDRARDTLAEHRDQLEELTQALLEKETLGKAELEEILGKRIGDSLQKETSSGQVTFSDLGLRESTLKTLKDIDYHTPSPIQAAFIPLALQGGDCTGQARTGTGKTAAFVLPIVERIDLDDRVTQALVLAPTRELSEQVANEARKLTQNNPCRCAVLVGGRPIRKQISELNKGVQLVVGTPGRVLDLLSRGELNLRNLRIVILDEADRMLDIGFRPDIEKILRQCPKDRQTLLLSATMPDSVERLARRYMKDPKRVDLSGDGIASSETIDQYFATVDVDRKFQLLVKLLAKERPSQALVFSRTKRGTEKLYRRFSGKLSEVAMMNGDMPQDKRDRVMKKFREGKIRLLIATDVVGRGIDVSGISHIVNYDIPEYHDDYVHRVGRTGRLSSDKKGCAITFVTREQGDQLTAIEMRINQMLPEYTIEGFQAYRPTAPQKTIDDDINPVVESYEEEPFFVA
eukprot:g8377.t1